MNQQIVNRRINDLLGIRYLSSNDLIKPIQTWPLLQPHDHRFDLAVDAMGSAYVTGYSNDRPIRGKPIALRHIATCPT